MPAEELGLAAAPESACLGGEALAAFGHDETERLDQIRVGVEDLFIAAWPISRTSFSSSATTFAVRGSPVNSAISPKKSPSLRVATVAGGHFH
jgi:hypothetical protein